MPRLQKILLADNRKSFCETCSEFLQLRGYQVACVTSPEECLSIIETDLPHLVVLDLRMRNDEDEGDLSGLMLAEQLPPHLTKIILTAFPTWEAARKALQIPEEGTPPAAFFVSKLEGLEVLERYVERAFTEHIRLNWDLLIDWSGEKAISLVHSIEAQLEENLLAQRAEELEDLLRRLFLNTTQINFDRVLWQQSGLLALQVFASASGKTSEPLLVICGQRDLVQREAANHRQQALQSKQVSLQSDQTEMAETIHYAAICYKLSSAQEGSVSSLQELYQAGLTQTTVGLSIDLANQRAWVDGRLLKLTAQEFRLLNFLYERRNQLCTRIEIIEGFFEYRYDKLDDTQDTLINTNISRLRTELETDPQNPRFLQTVRGRGYCLTVTD